MSAVVWKFSVTMPDATGRSWLEMPFGSTPLSVGIQEDDLVLWAMVPDATAEPERTRLIVVNTGRDIEMPEYARFLGTVTHRAGIVWHVFHA